MQIPVDLQSAQVQSSPPRGSHVLSGTPPTQVLSLPLPLLPAPVVAWDALAEEAVAPPLPIVTSAAPEQPPQPAHTKKSNRTSQRRMEPSARTPLRARARQESPRNRPIRPPAGGSPAPPAPGARTRRSPWGAR